VPTFLFSTVIKTQSVFITERNDLHLRFFGFAVSEGIGPIQPSDESSLSSSHARFTLSDIVTKLQQSFGA
jgi:hypothetical protein